MPRYISIHAPREGERPVYKYTTPLAELFQSTLPARGSDSSSISGAVLPMYFNPRSPRGGATANASPTTGAPSPFQSTLPARGSDHTANIRRTGSTDISIHAPREGERRSGQQRIYFLFLISIHAPREGERRKSTACGLQCSRISIHAPREGERLYARRASSLRA